MRMSDGNQDQLTGFVMGLLLGAAIGATAALLTAPQSGRRTRRKLGRTASQLKRNTGDRWDDLADEVKTRVDDALAGARKRIGND
jgi:gas vesicle protein